MTNAEIEATNKIITMSEVATKKMVFSIVASGKITWEELNTFTDVFCKKE